MAALSWVWLGLLAGCLDSDPNFVDTPVNQESGAKPTISRSESSAGAEGGHESRASADSAVKAGSSQAAQESESGSDLESGASTTSDVLESGQSTSDGADSSTTSSSDETGATGSNEASSDASTVTADSSASAEATTANSDGELDTGSSDDSSDTAGCVSEICFAYNADQTPDSRPTAMPNFVFAIPFRFDAGGRAVVRAELITGSVTGPARLSIWADSNNVRPQFEVSGVDWTVQQSIGWQGVDFFPPVMAARGESYWFVWTPPADSRMSLATGGEAISHVYSIDDGATWRLSSMPYYWMMRIHCCE